MPIILTNESTESRLNDICHLQKFCTAFKIRYLIGLNHDVLCKYKVHSKFTWTRSVMVSQIKRYLQISKRESFLKVLSDIFQIISQFLYIYTYSARNHIGPPRSKCCFFLERGIQRKTDGICEVSSDPGVDLFKWNSCEQEQTSASELKM